MLHKDLLIRYAERFDIEFEIQDIKHKQYNPPVFTVYEAYKDFAESDYDNIHSLRIYCIIDKMGGSPFSPKSEFLYISL